MSKLPPIPTPFTTRWREFRFQYVPLITFAAMVAMVILMRRHYVLPPNVIGQVEPISVRIVTVEPGALVELNVERFQPVLKGQILGVVEVMTTNALNAELALLEGDLQLMRARMSLDETRNQQNYYQEILSLQTDRATHEIDKVNMKKAEADFLRVSNLFHAKPVALETESNYDLARYTYLSLCTNVAVTALRLEQKEKMLPLLRGTNSLSLTEQVERDVRVQTDQLRSAQRVVLRSPIDGTVSAISNQVGEVVMGGKPILIITARESTNILAYARQPISKPPKVGDPVQVRKIGQPRLTSVGHVIQVGTQLEPVAMSLLGLSGVRYGYDVGLPFLVSIPKGMTLSPGERVDLMVNPPNAHTDKL